MKKAYTALALAFLLALSLCTPAMAAMEYGVIYDETESLGSQELTMQGEQTLPQLSQALGLDLRVDVLTQNSYDGLGDAAAGIYEEYDYGYGEHKEGVTLTILLEAQDGDTYRMVDENDWCVYARLSDERGNGQELSGAVYDAVQPYMAARAWNGEDMTMSAVALTPGSGRHGRNGGGLHPHKLPAGRLRRGCRCGKTGAGQRHDAVCI